MQEILAAPGPLANREKSEVEKLKEQLAAQAAERTAKLAERADTRELAKLKQRLADNTAIMRAESELGEQGVYCACIPTPDGRVVILKRADFAKYREFQDKVKPSITDIEELVSHCRFYPENEVFEDICEEYPGLLGVFSLAIAKLAGTLQEDMAKK